MSLIPIEKTQLEIGKPLPWTVFDPERNLMAEAGDVIQTKDQLTSLLNKHPCRELTWDAGGDQAEELTSEIITHTGQSKSGQQKNFPFEAMNLKVGDRLQIEPPAKLSKERFIVKLIGYLDKVSLLVTPPMDHGLRLPLIEGENLVVRVFSSQNAFGFASTIERICKLPFEYLHLSFPAEVQGMMIRKAPRIKTKIVATVASAQSNEADGVSSAIISNLSANGALLDSRKGLAEKGNALKVSFRINLHNIDAFLTVSAVVRAVFSDDALDNSGARLVHHGLEFVNLQPNDSVILQSMIYQTMIEHPHALA